MIKFGFVLALVFTALLLGTSFAHTLEISAKLQFDAAQWVRIQQSLYPAFATAGAFVELGALVTTALLAYLLRDIRLPFLMALATALCLAVAFFGIWIFITNGVNTQIATLTPEDIPPDWMALRRRWDYSHLARFILHLTGFTTLIGALLTLRGNELSVLR